MISRLILLSIAVMAGPASFAQQKDTAAETITLTKPGKGYDKAVEVTGTIVDAATHKPLAAINVSVADFSAALTDANGKFSIKVPDYNATLFLNGEGFQSKEVALRGRNNITTSLYEEAFNSIYDNVVLPFGVKQGNKAVNAVTSVNTGGNWQRNGETPDGYLQGKAAGLSPIMRSGTPNIGAYLLLRGYNSISATNQPLIVVDGMIYDISDYGSSLIPGHYTNALADIDLKDIENITVIKDAVSTYGTKAANGVILITTNHARQLATRIDAGVSTGINFKPAELPVMKSSDYRVFLSDILPTRGWSPDFIAAQPYMNDDPTNPSYYMYHNNTDWQSQVMHNSSIQDYYLKVSGGDDIARYALSMGYMNDGGITRDTKLTKYNVRFNGDLNLSKRLSATTNLSYTYYEQNLKDQGMAVQTNPLYLALTKAPFLNKNVVGPNGEVSPNLADVDTFGISNPAAAVANILDDSKVYRFFGSLNLKYKLTDHLSVFTLGGITDDEIREQTFVPRAGIANDTLSNAVADSRLGGATRRIFALYTDSYLDYTRTFHRIHQVQARAGFRYLHSSTEQDFALGYNSATDNFITVGTGVPTLRQTGGGIGQYAWTNAYLGVDYGLADKYFLSLNTAVDGSSRFGNQIACSLHLGGTDFAVMPSAGASWLVSSEKFMSRIHFIDVLKLRASVGMTGNDDIGDYTSKLSYVSQNLLGLEGLVRSNVANPALQWEDNTKVNFGMDLALLKERVNLTVDVYQNTTSHMLTYDSLNAASGFDYAITNGGGMQTKGIDISLRGRIINTASFKWDAGILVSAYKNKIMQLPGGPQLTSFGGATIITKVGSPANLFYGLRTRGIYSTDAQAAADGFTKKQSDGSYAPFQAGDVRFVDVNGDKIIDDNDRQVIGNPNPDFTGAFTTRLSWQRFSLEAIATFSKGNQVYNGVRVALESESSANNQLVSVENRWRAPGQVTNMPKATWGDPMGNSSFSDRWIEDGSFIRLKEVSISYNIPIKSSFFLKYSTVYITASNLFTFTKYLGYDPEFQAAESILARGVDVGLEPQYRTVMAGVRIGL